MVSMVQTHVPFRTREQSVRLLFQKLPTFPWIFSSITLATLASKSAGCIVPACSLTWDIQYLFIVPQTRSIEFNGDEHGGILSVVSDCSLSTDPTRLLMWDGWLSHTSAASQEVGHFLLINSRKVAQSSLFVLFVSMYTKSSLLLDMAPITVTLWPRFGGSVTFIGLSLGIQHLLL